MTSVRQQSQSLAPLPKAGRPSFPGKLGLGIVLLLMLGGCSLFLKSDDTQCDTPTDCEVATGSSGWECVANVCKRLTSAGGPWGCLEHAVGEQQYEAGVRNMKLADEGTGEIIKDGDIKICTYFDIACANPLSTATGPNNDDMYIYSVPEGFNGYLEMHSSGRMPTLVRLNAYVKYDFKGDPDLSPFPMVDRALFEGIVILAGETPDPTAGLIIGGAFDCDGGDSAGIRVVLTPEEANAGVFYLTDSNYPSLDATETEKNGRWGAINVQPGFIEAVALRASDDAFIGKVSFLVRKGHMSAASIGPSPE